MVQEWSTLHFDQPSLGTPTICLICPLRPGSTTSVPCELCSRLGSLLILFGEFPRRKMVEPDGVGAM